MRIYQNIKQNSKHKSDTQPVNQSVINHCTNHYLYHSNNLDYSNLRLIQQQNLIYRSNSKKLISPVIKVQHLFLLFRSSFIVQNFLLILFCYIIPTIQTTDLTSSGATSNLYSSIYPEYKDCKDKQLDISKNETYRNLLADQCAPLFDNFICWHNTVRSQTASKLCPQFSENSSNIATRDCLSTGEWSKTVNYDACGSNRYQDTKIEYDYLEHIHNTVWKNVNLSYPPIYYDELNKCIDTSLREDYLTQFKTKDYCNSTFDGYRCWPRTNAGEIAYLPCPPHLKASEIDSASKQCLEDGTWFKHPSSLMIWSNYTRCHDYEDLAFRNLINTLYVIGYTISLSAMLISLGIFFSFRSLKCLRIFVHKNLFFSFIIANVHWIYVYTGIYNQVEVLQNNSIICRIVFSCTKYFTHTNYTWTFSEGLYLHACVVYGFVNEKYLIYYLMLIGWLSPLIYYLPYLVFRSLSTVRDDTIRCWVDDTVGFENIVQYPIFIIILLNIFFLCNIIRVLRSKLRFNREANNHHIKTVKAFFVLFPLLSLQYVITFNRPPDGSRFEVVYEYILLVSASLQGLFVSLIYCFFNNEVITAIKTSFNRQMLSKNNNNQRSIFIRNRSVCTTVV